VQGAAAALRRGELAAARADFDRAMAEYAKTSKVDPVDRSDALRGIAELDNAEGKYAQSLKHAWQAVQALADLPAGSPVRIEPWRMLATAQGANADLHGAVATLEQALDVAHAALGEDSNKVANIENDLAVALNAQGRYREAIAHLEKSIAISEKIRPGARVATAFSMINLGSTYESLGDYAKAESLMRQGIAAIEAETPDESQLDFFRCNLARTRMLQGDIAGARALIERALQSIAAREGETSMVYAFQTFRLARVELAGGNVDAAEQYLRDAVATLDPLLPPDHALRTQIHVLRGMLAKARGDLATAQSEFETAEKGKTNDPVDLAVVRLRLAGALLARGDLVAARGKLDQAVPVLEGALLPEAVERVEARSYQTELARRETATAP
jgi:tetratricopeptide (TPR) repeat protein